MDSNRPAGSLFPQNVVPSDDELPPGFRAFLEPLHRRFTPWQRFIIESRRRALEASWNGAPPDYATTVRADVVKNSEWSIAVPDWMADQRNQMTGPADDAELCVKMLNSGAPGVMIDLEDSMANTWECTKRGVANAIKALHGELTYAGKKGETVAIKPSATVTFTRVRGLHMSQHGVYGETVSASVFDAALLVFGVDPAKLRHPLCLYIPKSESAEEARWWGEFLKALALAKGLPADAIKCMALVESHPLAYQVEEFLFELREHILGLNLGRWDYMASLIHFTLHDPKWVLPDRNTIPHDVPFFQKLRTHLVEICHKRGALAIGGMTALYPSRTDAPLNARALAVLEKDKKNEAAVGMDGAWTGHPDQNAVAVAQFPRPNQIGFRPSDAEPSPDLRPLPAGVGVATIEGTRAAARTTIRYRAGVLAGRGASLLDGYMEDLATDRIYRLMIAQRVRHALEVYDDLGAATVHTPDFVRGVYREELARIIAALGLDPESSEARLYENAARISLAMIEAGEFDPS
ncbi:MAG TPA: hypothetical protein VLC10_03235 [Patescibacteria group bacterium]|nr:hypothetical protein [Patescibacteria group bacterium]